jgi:hypothetical protein
MKCWKNTSVDLRVYQISASSVLIKFRVFLNILT